MADEKKYVKIGITGHRNLSPAQTALLEPVLKRAIDNIIYCHKSEHGHPEVLPIFTSPLAEGADTLFANTAIKNYDCKLMVYLPFEKENYLEDFETAASKKEFSRLLTNPKVADVSIHGSITNESRENLYLNVGKAVVDDNEYIIAIWDKKKAKGKGGTGDIIRYAVKSNKNVVVINPEETDMHIAAFHLPEFENHTPEAQLKNNTGKAISYYFRLYDRLAIDNQRKYKKNWESCFIIGWLGIAFVLACKAAFHFEELFSFLFTLVELICLVIIYFLIRSEKKHKYHSRYLQNRFVAETLRINELIYDCGLYPLKIETKVIHKTLSDLELLAPLILTNKIAILTSNDHISIERKKTLIRKFVSRQKKYHQDRKENREYLNKRNHYIKIVCLIFIIAIACHHAVDEFVKTDFLKYPTNFFARNTSSKNGFETISMFFYIFIPATLAKFEATKYLNDWEKLITQSKYMSEFFDGILKKIDNISTEDELHKILIALNENMYWENLDWEMFMQNKNEAIAA